MDIVILRAFEKDVIGACWFSWSSLSGFVCLCFYVAVLYFFLYCCSLFLGVFFVLFFFLGMFYCTFWVLTVF